MGSTTKTPQWLADKGFVLGEDGTYYRPSPIDHGWTVTTKTPMLDKALKQKDSTGVLEAIPATIYGSKEYLPKQNKESLKTPEITPNKKIRNATKVEIDGEKYDSRLEAHMGGLFKQHGIRFERQVCYILQDKFRYGTELIRPITLTVDFRLPDYNIIVDPKGFKNDIAPVKYKMLKRHLFDKGLYTEILMPKNHKECSAVINKLLKIAYAQPK